MIYQGFHDDSALHEDGDTPDLRVRAVMASFTNERDAQTVADFASLDEFDGSGYTPYDVANVYCTYDDASGELRIGGDSDIEGFGATVDAGSGPIVRLLVVRHVDGAGGDIPWCSRSASEVVNGNGSALGVVIPATGFLFGSSDE